MSDIDEKIAKYLTNDGIYKLYAKHRIAKTKLMLARLQVKTLEAQNIKLRQENSAIKKAAENQNQNPYIKVLEDEIKAKDARIEELEQAALSGQYLAEYARIQAGKESVKTTERAIRPMIHVDADACREEEKARLDNMLNETIDDTRKKLNNEHEDSRQAMSRHGKDNPRFAVSDDLAQNKEHKTA